MSLTVGFANPAAVTIGGKTAATINSLNDATNETSAQALGTEKTEKNQVRTGGGPVQENSETEADSNLSITVKTLLKRMKELQKQLQEQQQQLAAAQAASYPTPEAKSQAVMSVQGQIAQTSGELMQVAAALVKDPFFLMIPDLVRAHMAVETLVIRRPDATRPFQHVLDVLRGYLLHAEALWGGVAPQALNFGPRDSEISAIPRRPSIRSSWTTTSITEAAYSIVSRRFSPIPACNRQLTSGVLITRYPGPNPMNASVFTSKAVDAIPSDFTRPSTKP